MTDRPKSLARMTGLFFLITLLTGIFAQGFLAERLIVHGDAAATAGNVLLGGGANAHYLSVFSADQLQALSLLFLTVNDRAAGMGLAFFGFCDVLNGWLIFRSIWR